MNLDIPVDTFWGTIIATFGSAQLVRNVSRRYELRGSNDHNLAEAALNDRVYPGLKKKC